jgi:hypothetical protein
MLVLGADELGTNLPGHHTFSVEVMPHLYLCLCLMGFCTSVTSASDDVVYAA